MKRLKVPAARLDYRMVAEQSRSFVDLVRPALNKLRTGLDESASVAQSDLPLVACVATLLALGLELHFKAIHIGIKREPPEFHSLLRLFDSLPLPERQDIEVRYVAKLKSVDPTHALSLNIQIRETTNPQKAWPEQSQFKPIDQTLRAMLARSANAFVAWRYFYEAVPHNRPLAEKNLDYVPLFLLWESVDEFIKANAR